MKKKDIFGDDENASNERNEFAALLDLSMGGRRVSVGDTVLGEILSIGKDEAFVSTGTPIDGSLPVSELLDENKQLKYKVGDRIEVKVVRARGGEIQLMRAGSTSASKDFESLEDAFDMELPVEGKVTEQVKGGFRVEIQGKLAFCPISQMDFRATKEPLEYIGKRFEFIITQFDERGRNIVVSRRKLLDLQRAESEGEFLQKAKHGDILKGQITRIEKFGAFVALGGGVEGLIPISELAWGRVQDPHDIVHVGQEVTVLLLRVTEEGDRLRLSLSLKQGGGEGDPWLKVTETFPVGGIFDGTIERKETYGLFVNLAPGITGLMPRSKWRDRLDGQQYENRKKGEKIRVQVDQIQFDEHKLTLAPPGEMDDGSWRAHAAQKSTGFGTLGDLLKQVKPKS